MNIDDLTFGVAKKLAVMLSGCASAQGHPYDIGELYVIRTVTMHLVGRVAEVLPQEIVLEEAAWLADSGRWTNALNTGEVKECEPFPDGRVIVGRGAITDAARWSHEPLRVVK